MWQGYSRHTEDRQLAGIKVAKRLRRRHVDWLIAKPSVLKNTTAMQIAPEIWLVRRV
jgi:hypothetical protein